MLHSHTYLHETSDSNILGHGLKEAHAMHFDLTKLKAGAIIGGSLLFYEPHRASQLRRLLDRSTLVWMSIPLNR